MKTYSISTTTTRFIALDGPISFTANRKLTWPSADTLAVSAGGRTRFDEKNGPSNAIKHE